MADTEGGQELILSPWHRLAKSQSDDHPCQCVSVGVFLTSCQQIVEMLSNTVALDGKIKAQHIYLNEPTISMQEFIKENAMETRDENFYETKMVEYNVQKTDTEKVTHGLQDKRAARLSRKELLEGLIQTMSKEGIVTDTFDGKLWLLLVEKVTVGTDGGLTFTLRNGMEI